MKKLYSLIRASMTSGMNIFKIKQKRDNKKSSIALPIFLSLCFMFAIWSNANMIFEKLAPMHLQMIVISLVVFATSIMTIVEGVYKTGPLLFNCKDDQLLLSLPIKKSTVLFVRIFKLYIFELMFNSLFIIPLIVAYLRWAENLEWSFFLTSFIMLLFLPAIPVALSCIFGMITTSIASRFKFKNLSQIIISMGVIFCVFYLSYNMDSLAENIAKHATSINDFIMKLYYPAGIYAKLVSQFNIIDLLIFIFINIITMIVTIIILSKFYFKINTRMKSISTSKKIKVDDLTIKSSPKIISLIKKELNIFFKTPVFVVNAGFSLILYIVFVIGICLKYNDFLEEIKDFFPEINFGNYLSIIVFVLIAFVSFMTSITNSVISLEGRNINILKSLPIKVKTILLSKVLAALTITTPPILLGDIILFIRFRLNLLEIIFLSLFSILIPLVSHFIGLIMNLKYPKLDFENSAEVVKQSTSSFFSVMLGMILLIISVMLVTKLIEFMNPILVLLIFLCIYLLMDIILYIYLIKISEKEFKKLSV